MQKLLTLFKLTILLAATTILLLTKNWLIVIGLFLACIITYGCFRQKITLLPKIFTLALIVLFTLLFQVLFNTSYSFLNRIVFGLMAGTKIITISLLTFLFTATTSISTILTCCSFLPRNWQLVVTITFGILPAIIVEANNIKIAQCSRGLKWYQGFLPLIVPLLHRSLKRAEQIGIMIAKS